MTTIDWGSLRKTAEESTRPLPNDWYDVVVERAEATVASTGSEMIKLVLQVTSGPHVTRKLWTNFVLSPDNGFALGIFFRNLAAFGVDPSVVAPQGGLDPVAAALVGRSARAQVGVRNWQGQDRNEIQQLVSSGGAQVPSPVAGPPSPSFGPTAGPVVGNVPGPVAGPPSPAVPTSTPAPTPQAPTPSTPSEPDLPF